MPLGIFRKFKQVVETIPSSQLAVYGCLDTGVEFIRIDHLIYKNGLNESSLMPDSRASLRRSEGFFHEKVIDNS